MPLATRGVPTVRMRQICASVAHSVNACSKKHQASPALAMIRPPMAGPTKRAPLSALECSATAFGNRLRSRTSSARKAWRTGISKANNTPRSSAMAIKPLVLIQPPKASTANTRHCTHTAPSTISSRRLAWVAVGNEAGHRRHQQRRRHRRKADDAQHQRRAAQPVREPGERDVVREAADQRDRLADEIAAEGGSASAGKRLIVTGRGARAGRAVRQCFSASIVQGCSTTRPTTRPFGRSSSAWFTCFSGRRSSGICGSSMRCASATSSRSSFNPAT